ncbi:MAG: hypothetical protein AAGC74_03050 [Verrucomicrobiota bacterium]
MQLPDKQQRSSLWVGFGIILFFAAALALMWAATYLPGPVGRTFGLLTGMLWTPTIMEPTLLLAGLMAILILNHHRRKTEGPELVYLETVDGPDANLLPEQARSATFPEKPQPPSGDEMIDTIEGALELNDHDQVTRLLLELPQDLLECERILAVRLQLAHANQDPNHIRGLSKKLRELNPKHPLLKR